MPYNIFLFLSTVPLQLIITSILGAILAGLSCSLTGVFVVNLKIPSIGYCMSHAAFAGASLGLLIDANLRLINMDYSFDPLITAVIFTIIVAAILGPLTQKAKLETNIIISILFTLMIALGFIFLSAMPSGVLSASAVSILWGSIFGISMEDVLYLVILNGILIIILVFFYKEFLAIMFDKKLAQASGINVSIFFFFVLMTTGIVVAFSIKIIGALLVYALIVNPCSTILEFSYDMRKIFALSPVIGVGTCILGYFTSLIFDFPIGSSIIIVSCIIFITALIISPKRRRKDSINDRKNMKKSRDIEFFNSLAEEWDEKNPHKPEVLRTFLDILSIKPGSKILDVGTGTGVMIPYFIEKLSNNCTIIAIDNAEKMIEVAKRKFPHEKYPTIEFKIQDITKISIHQEYDAILCHNCFPHFENQEETVRIMTKGLKMGGKLMVAHSKSRDWINNLHRNTDGVEHDYLPNIKELSLMMIKSNLKVLDHIDDEDMFFILSEKVT
ncbi:MAG: methyltransferase domain-containing protein [Candidatus Lokiarchaeota archaeon]|nr:methyltransferase domain-containing protein [Candidatus Lokiarchaeota archaeon]